MRILGIDPGLTGGLALLTEERGKPLALFSEMPCVLNGKDREIPFKETCERIALLKPDHIYLERAKPIAMGAKHAFNYGKGFRTLEIAIYILKIPVTYVEPHTWTKVMLEGISKDMQPKIRNGLAVQRLLPHFVDGIPKGPKSGKLHEGIVDALLIAEFGRRKMGGKSDEVVSVDDF